MALNITPVTHPLQFPEDATEWERACYAGFLALCGSPQTTFAEWRASRATVQPAGAPDTAHDDEGNE